MVHQENFIEVLLAADSLYTEDIIVDYMKMEEHTPTRTYAKFVKLNINNPERLEIIQPFELFLIATPEPNAWAWFHKGKYVMCIHLSLFKIVEKRIKEKLQTLPIESRSILSEGYFNQPITEDYLLYQFITVFISYHEQAHLNQFFFGQNGVAMFERYNFNNEAGFDKIAHAMEIDADIFAAENMNGHIFQFWNSFPEEYRTQRTLEVMLSISLLSCLILFYELSYGWKDWYTFDYDHPNSLIRVCYIHDVLSQTAKANEKKMGFQINAQRVFNDTLLMADHFISDQETNGVTKFASQFFHHLDEINSYIKQEMYPFMDTLNFLNSTQRKKTK